MMAQLAEVLLPQPVERRAVELRRAADEVVDLRLERLAARVVPGVLGHVPVLDEDVLRQPVLRLSRQPVASLEQQDALPRRGQPARQRPSTCTRADDDHVIRIHSGHAPDRRSETMILAAASMSARCEKA